MLDERPSVDEPLVSVVIPTYRRPDLLPRAVESVLAQTYQKWELIVSDDEDPPGQSALYLASLTDSRVRVIRNPGPHGQCGNVNFAFAHARGEWIKPLFDDDRLRPACLDAMTRAVAAARRAGGDPVLATCGIVEYRDDVEVRPGVHDGPLLVLVARRDAALFSLGGHHVAGGVPTQWFFHRRAIDRSILFEQPLELVSGVDGYWVMRARALGDNLIVNLPLAEFYQGAHSTVTSGMTDAALDREFEFLTDRQYALIEPGVSHPSLSYFQQVVRLQRAAHRLKRRKVAEAVALAMRCWNPRAWARAAVMLAGRQRNRLTLRPEHRVLDDAGVRAAVAGTASRA